MRARRDRYFAIAPGASPPQPEAAPLPPTLADLGRPPVALGALDHLPDAPAARADRRALDADLARRRGEASR